MKTTAQFLSLLETHKNKSLLFEYAPGKIIPANYHLTEVKHTNVASVDCGGATHSWQETVIQLWESPTEKDRTNYMSCFKALGILNKVSKIKALNPNALVKFEYGNSHFHTAHLHVKDVTWNSDKLMLHLTVNPTDCKAKEACGITENTVSNPTSCAPGSGCC